MPVVFLRTKQKTAAGTMFDLSSIPPAKLLLGEKFHPNCEISVDESVVLNLSVYEPIKPHKVRCKDWLHMESRRH